MSIESRFWAKVDKSGGPDACWTWTASCNQAGYGRFRVGRRYVRAHRFSWKIANGLILYGLQVLHMCDNPGCVNPEHLFLGTNADNMADKARKGRGNQPRGEQHPQAKLTEAQVREIRDTYAAGGVTQREIGRRFRVSPAQVCQIVHGKFWRGCGTTVIQKACHGLLKPF